MEIERGETVVLNTDWTVGEPMMLADIGGKEIRCMEKGVGGMVAHAEWLPAIGVRLRLRHSVPPVQ